jgi:hypothetical protein
MPIKGSGAVEAKPVTSADTKVLVPELIRMKEFYGDDVKSHIDKCPGVISIPRNTIHSIKATELTSARYTFVRTDSGEEVTTFRPRQVADAIKIELSSAGTLKLDGGKVNIPLDSARELRVEYTAESVGSADPFADHFHHYFPYIERPAALDFDVVPKKVWSCQRTVASCGTPLHDDRRASFRCQYWVAGALVRFEGVSGLANRWWVLGLIAVAIVICAGSVGLYSSPRRKFTTRNSPAHGCGI